MKKRIFALLMAASMAISPVTAYMTAAPVSAAENASDTALVKAPATKTMYRLYNDNSGEHFYTSNQGERDELALKGWIYEGVAWIAPASSSTPVYRLYNPVAGDHHYTTSAGERDELVNKYHWNYEGIGWYSGGSVPVYREYNPNARTGTHNYTVSKGENDELVRKGWRPEGIGWYAQSEKTASQVEIQNGVPYSNAPMISVNIDMGNGQTKVIHGRFRDDTAQEEENEINNLRTKLGRSPLTPNSALRSMAKTRAAESAVIFEHIRPNGQPLAYTEVQGSQTGFNWPGRTLGNLWRISSGHFGVLMDPKYTSFGAGVFESSENGETYDMVCLY